MNNFKVNEFNVPVPWGHVAVKAWGDENNEPVLVTHGRMDNAGAFDRLIPYLPDSFYYICVDLPGHGKSSHFPPYLPIYTLNYVLVYKLLMQYFKRKNYIIIGHSYGGQIGFLFAQMYPSYVTKLIMIDTVHMYPITAKELITYLVESFDTNITILEKQTTRKPPTYTYEEALAKLGTGRQGIPLIPEAAEALIQRAIEPAGDGRYSFTFDQRMKNFINPLHDFRYIIENLKEDPVKCPILIILGEKSYTKTHMQELIEEMKDWNNVRIEYAEGHHDVHNNNPELIAPYVNKFLLMQKGKL